MTGMTAGALTTRGDMGAGVPGAAANAITLAANMALVQGATTGTALHLVSLCCSTVCCLQLHFKPCAA